MSPQVSGLMSQVSLSRGHETRDLRPGNGGRNKLRPSRAGAGALVAPDWDNGRLARCSHVSIIGWEKMISPESSRA